MAIAATGALLLSPLLLSVAALILVLEGPPVFHRARRLGRSGRPFILYKFRTMRVGAEATGAPITRDRDPRVTVMGRWLRAAKIDELPQLLNVLRGEMAVVGPRPEDPQLLDGASDAVRRLLSCKPGLTSPASIRFRNEQAVNRDGSLEYYRRSILPAKAAIDLAYLESRTTWTDLATALRTAVSLFVARR